jgi:uncharacterized protein
LLWRALVPLVIVIAGVSATGKSTVAAALARETGFPVLRTDVIRKARAGLSPTARGSDALYRDAVSRDTYAALGREAAGLAAAGVVVDGTFRRRCDRAAFFAELPPYIDALVVECRAPADVLRARAVAREAKPDRVSDAGPAVVAAQVGAFEPLDEVGAAEHLTLMTDRPAGEIVMEIAEAAARRSAASRAR